RTKSDPLERYALEVCVIEGWMCEPSRLFARSSRGGVAGLPPPPSSNRTGGFPASGLPENFSLRHAQESRAVWDSTADAGAATDAAQGVAIERATTPLPRGGTRRPGAVNRDKGGQVLCVAPRPTRSLPPSPPAPSRH